MKLKKISVKNFIETLTDNELKNVVGGYSCRECNYAFIWSDGYVHQGVGTFCADPNGWIQDNLELLNYGLQPGDYYVSQITVLC